MRYASINCVCVGVSFSFFFPSFFPRFLSRFFLTRQIPPRPDTELSMSRLNRAKSPANAMSPPTATAARNLTFDNNNNLVIEGEGQTLEVRDNNTARKPTCRAFFFVIENLVSRF